MRCGYFDHEHRESVITRPDTSLPWINDPAVKHVGGQGWTEYPPCILHLPAHTRIGLNRIRTSTLHDPDDRGTNL